MKMNSVMSNIQKYKGKDRCQVGRERSSRRTENLDLQISLKKGAFDLVVEDNSNLDGDIRYIPADAEYESKTPPSNNPFAALRLGNDK